MIGIVNSIQFGHDLRGVWTFKENYTNLNHGSYGATPGVVQRAQDRWRTVIENDPEYVRWQMYTDLNNARSVVAAYVNADPEDIAFEINASHGMNALLRSLMIPKGMKILYFNTAYQMVKNVLNHQHKYFGVELLQVNITFPTSNDMIIEAVNEVLNNDNTIYLAVFSHITSVPSLILPVEKLTALCKSHGILVGIDGAHTMGQIPLNIPAIGADFYVTNGHKWMYTPKGSAIIWADKDFQNLVFPPAISEEGLGNTQFQMEFSYQGTSDVSAFLSFVDGIEFRTSLGDSAIMDYMHSLAVAGGELLASMWGTETLISSDMIGSMTNVRLPCDFNSAFVGNITQALRDTYNTWVPTYPLQGHWYVRVSAQIYLELSDFEMLGNAMLEILKCKKNV